MHMKKILVIGSSNIDYVVGVKDMPQTGETIMSRTFARNFGGKGANQAFACGRLGGQTSFISAVGDDGLGEPVKGNLAAAGVDTDGVRTAKGTPTGMAFICVNSEGNNSIVVIPGANDACDAEWIRENDAAIAGSDIVMTQLETPVDGVWDAIRRAAALNKTVILDPAPAPEAPIPDDVYRCITYLTPNETELHSLTGLPVETEEEIAEAAGNLLAHGVKNVLVTIGERGAMLVNKAGRTVYPGYRVDPVDTTAAGDTFNAAMAVGLCGEDATMEAIMAFANAAAALSATRKGAQPSVPTAAEVREFIARYAKEI